MEIKLYKTVTPNNFITKELTDEKTLNITVRGSIDVKNPVVLVETQTDIYQYNYAYILQFNRYYYIKNCTYVRNGVVQLELSVDVLMSFRDEILNNTAVILRQEEKFNSYLGDNELMLLNKKRVQYKEFSGGFDSTTHIILAVNGGLNNA